MALILGSWNAAIKAVEREIRKVQTDVEQVERKIVDTEAAITQIAVEISKVEAEISKVEDVQSASVTEEQLHNKKAHLRTKAVHLRTKKQHLRTRKEHLRTEKAQLHTEEAQLRNKKEQLLRATKNTTPTMAEGYLRRALLMDPPSQILVAREQLDVGGPLIHNWRPSLEEAGGLLPELVDRTFAEAVEAMAAASGTHIDQATISAASELCHLGADVKVYANIYGDGVDKTRLSRAVRGLLQRYLLEEEDGGRLAAISSGFAGAGVRPPDWALGDAPEKPSNLFLVVMVKPDFAAAGDLPFQGASYLLHFWRRRVGLRAFQDTCCPAFLLEVVGAQVRLSAMAWLDRVTVFPLTPLLNLLPAHPVTDCLLMPVARMLAALRMGVRQLAAAHEVAAAAAAAEDADSEADMEAEAEAEAGSDAEDADAEDADAETGDADADAEEEEPDAMLLLAMAACRSSDKALPWPIRTDARYLAATAQRLVPHNPTYYVRLAAGSSGGSGGGGSSGGGGGGNKGRRAKGGGGGVEDVAVKLCRKYGLAAHRAWAELGLAPQVLRSEQLPGGWLLVETEWLPAPQWRRLSDLAGEERAEAMAAVEAALARAHAATGMAHGDMRPPNCLVRRGAKKRPRKPRNPEPQEPQESQEAEKPAARSWQVAFLDFEWAGLEGEATYPACLNPDIPWPEGVGWRQPLQRAHDVQLLAASAAAAGRAGGGARGARRGPGAARSLRAATCDRPAAPLGKAVAVVTPLRGAGVGAGWRQRAATSGSRLAAPGRRLAW